MKVVDLFCGCGGMGLGFQQAGFEIVYACDIDKYAIQSYRRNIGEHGVLADITKVKATDVPKADVWTFGFPCQDLSVAGKQAGMEVGTRSGLFYEVMRLLDECDEKPSIIMAENVKGLKPYLPVLEQEFAKRGYQMTVQLYNSKYWGVPQNRERYYVVGHLNGALKIPEENRSNVPKLSSILENHVDDKYFIESSKAKRILERAAELYNDPQDAFVTTDGVAYYSTARYHKGIAPSSVGKSRDTHIIVAGMLDVLGKDQIRRVHDPEGISPTVTAVQGGHHHVKILAERGRPNGDGYSIKREFRKDGLTNTLTRNPQLNYVYENLAVRRLTPREYARLQGFPDNYEIVVSDTQAYKQFGNSVTVPLVKAIAESIKAVLLNEQSTTES